LHLVLAILGRMKKSPPQTARRMPNVLRRPLKR
jgi:hypothetical protein